MQVSKVLARRYTSLATALALMALVLPIGLTACGDPLSFCGDKIRDEGEECDDGNNDDTDGCLSTCKARAISALTIQWEFNRNDEVGFSGDKCTDLGISTVAVTLEGGDTTLVESESCSFNQIVFTDIPAGNYTAKLRPLTSGGELLIDTEFVGEATFGGGSETKSYNIPEDRWVNEYTGSFYFRVEWAGQDCVAAGVVDQRLSLVAGGTTSSGQTTTGGALDGSATAPCVPLDEEQPQTALLVPYGPGGLMVEGLNLGGTVVYSQIFETFIGAGVSNPELTFDVPLK